MISFPLQVNCRFHRVVVGRYLTKLLFKFMFSSFCGRRCCSSSRHWIAFPRIWTCPMPKKHAIINIYRVATNGQLDIWTLPWLALFPRLEETTDFWYFTGYVIEHGLLVLEFLHRPHMLPFFTVGVQKLHISSLVRQEPRAPTPIHSFTIACQGQIRK